MARSKIYWTAFVRWPDGDLEEIDLRAADREEARRLFENELERSYNPGWQIDRIVCRPNAMFV